MTGPPAPAAPANSAETPFPVRTVARMIGGWIGRLGRVWIEGQLTEISRRPGAGTVFMVLRDPVADVSLRVTCSRMVFDGVAPPLADGARVVVHAKPDFHLGRGSLALAVTDIRPVGVGELLARLERLKSQLAAEGLFDADRKRPLPFLPKAVGLITGRASAAEKDVVETARRRWPGVEFEIREVAVQGGLAVNQVCEALKSLDRIPHVEVIVIARGGGSLEDLLPFSDESLCRAVAAARTPVVSAIGHEPDSPLLDYVADVRAATPTDAARRVVPEVVAELELLGTLRGRARRAVTNRLDSEARQLTQILARPALAAPHEGLARRTEEVVALRERTRRCVTAAVGRAAEDLAHASARVHALSPAATLARGYAVVQLADGGIVRSPDQAPAGTPLRVRVELGTFPATAAAPAVVAVGATNAARAPARKAPPRKPVGTELAQAAADPATKVAKKAAAPAIMPAGKAASRAVTKAAGTAAPSSGTAGRSSRASGTTPRRPASPPGVPPKSAATRATRQQP